MLEGKSPGGADPAPRRCCGLCARMARQVHARRGVVVALLELALDGLSDRRGILAADSASVRENVAHTVFTHAQRHCLQVLSLPHACIYSLVSLLFVTLDCCV